MEMKKLPRTNETIKRGGMQNQSHGKLQKLCQLDMNIWKYLNKNNHSGRIYELFPVLRNSLSDSNFYV